MTSNHAHLTGSPIYLNPSLLPLGGCESVEAAIRKIVRSVRFEFLRHECAIRLLGPDMSYHCIDPYLQDALASFKEGMTIGDIFSYKSEESLFDLCFEDSWTGYFISNYLCKLPQQEDLVLIHLDDHTDMMSTLLVQCGSKLKDPATNSSFDAANANDWEAAINTGCISIGNFITPLFYSARKVHIRHINNTENKSPTLQSVTREFRCYDLIPNRKFVAVSTGETRLEDSAGTYMAGANADVVLNSVPNGRVIIHIDLDYFINDFNGNPDRTRPILWYESRHSARQKLDRFFDALSVLDSAVDRWIIATSPGFCSACHWSWLLAEISNEIENFHSL